MITTILAKIFGTKNERELKRIQALVDHINSLESSVLNLSEAELTAKTNIFRERISRGESLDSVLPEAFAVVREAGKRTLNMRHFDVQLIGGVVLHEGKISEMKTGEGKTLVSTLPLYLNALAGKGGMVGFFLTVPNLPPYTPTGTIAITDPGHTHPTTIGATITAVSASVATMVS